MRINYVYDTVYPWEAGGIQKRVWELAHRLAETHDVHWYGLHYWDGPAVYERENVTLHGVAEPRELYVNGRRSITEALTYSARLLQPLLAEDADVIDCQAFPYFPGFPSRLSASLQDATLCVTWHEVWDDYWYDYLGRKGVFGKSIETLLGRVSHVNVAVSEHTRQNLEQNGASCDYLVPNGIDIAEIDTAPATDESVDVLFVGRFIKEKNPSLVVDTIDQLREEWPHVQCYMVGEGPERETVEEQIGTAELSDNIELLGRLDEYEDVLGLLKAADVFVLPSRREGFGITVLEALACGTPTVTIAHPQNAAAELVTAGETGIVTNPDPKSLAWAVREVSNYSSSACVGSAAEYEWDAIAKQAEAVYQEVA